MRRAALALLCALAMPAAAGAQQPRPTVQQQFDAAETAMQARNWAEALRLLDALEVRTGSNARTVGLVRVRRGIVLVALGRSDEAAAAIRLGLSALSAEDATLSADRFRALLNLGLIAEQGLDYPEALRNYRLADALAISDVERLHLRRGMIQTQLFTNVEAALAEADATLRLVAAGAPDNRALAGEVHTLKGRALLNLGRFAEARRELETAMRLLGNLTLRVDRADLIARSDLAIAALLAGDAEAARRYLAYTGAGQFQRGYLTITNTEPLQCGSAVAPEDVAVVEIFVAADGSVASAKPIYASRQGPSAVLLARSVRRWAFDARGTGDIPDLFRSVVRLEVRCSRLPPPGRRLEDDAALDRLAAADPAWARAIEQRGDRPASALREELAGAERTGTEPRAVLPLVVLLAARAEPSHVEREGLYRRALTMAAGLGAPPQVLASIALAIAVEQQAQREDRTTGYSVTAYDGVLDLPEIRGAPEAAAYIQLARARLLYWRGEADRALALVTGVRGMPDLRSRHPLIVEALEIERVVHAGRGNREAASAAVAAIGPGAERCGLWPRRLPLSVSSRDFPDDALRWGFEGFASAEMEIAETGRMSGTRILFAYPPFVFGPSAARIAMRTSYEPSYIVGGGACALDRQTVFFRLPRPGRRPR
jgi:tetratricopeptide (TPR) repeat protein